VPRHVAYGIVLGSRYLPQALECYNYCSSSEYSFAALLCVEDITQVKEVDARQAYSNTTCNKVGSPCRQLRQGSG
jgi:hypothetical protein